MPPASFSHPTSGRVPSSPSCSPLALGSPSDPCLPSRVLCRDRDLVIGRQGEQLLRKAAVAKEQALHQAGRGDDQKKREGRSCQLSEEQLLGKSGITVTTAAATMYERIAVYEVENHIKKSYKVFRPFRNFTTLQPLVVEYIVFSAVLPGRAAN